MANNGFLVIKYSFIYSFYIWINIFFFSYTRYTFIFYSS